MEPDPIIPPNGSVLVVGGSDEVEILLAGEIDMTVRGDLLRAAQLVAAQPAPSVIVNVAQVTFADSTLLHGLAALRQICASVGTTVVVRDPAPAIARLIALRS